ncbi:D-glycero-beta-D-manno-heptose 1-phosphate adenylyltransferase [bacterium]|nr:D-glycero-beta-D-manno-heptose 1-phosphate adenylyltransferase [bacterium]
MESRLLSLPELLTLKTKWQNAGKTVVFTNGCFDILHAGHVRYLEDAKALGDYLIVGLNSDNSVRELKGPTRPINNEIHRGLVIAGLRAVDAVIIFDTPTPIPLLEILRPDIHVKGGDYESKSLPEYGTVTQYGGKVIIVPFHPGLSSTNIIGTILDRLGTKS